MKNHDKHDRSLYGKLTKLAERPVADRAAVVGMLMVCWLAWYTFVFVYARSRPDMWLYIDRRVLPFGTAVTAGLLGVWCILTGIALLLRLRALAVRWLAHATAQCFVLTVGWGSYLTGHHSSLFLGVALGGVGIGVVLFNRSAILPAVAVLLLIVIATNVADQIGVIPYAPLFVQAPFAAGMLARSWLVLVAAPTFAILLVHGVLIIGIVEAWRDREKRLAEATEQLGRANDLISRYVAAQVAKQILDGDYEAIQRHSRRRLTIFFSDVVGFAQLADTMEPEDLSRILNEYLSEMSAIAEQYGATIDKFIGDAIMAFFGAPVMTDDRLDALRGVRMAVAMLRRLTDLRVKWKHEGFDEVWTMRIGINTGQASVGNFGSQRRLDYTAIGRQVNLAARLQAAAEQGKILISHATWLLVQDEIACVSRGEIHVKGLPQPVRVYEIDADAVDVAATLPSAGQEPPQALGPPKIPV